MLSKSIIPALVLGTSVSAQTITTVDVALKFHVVSSNNLTNNRLLQLRTNEYETEFGYPNNTFHYVGIDSTSPVLHANLTSGVLYSESKGTVGHNGYLNLEQEYAVGNTSQYLFSFANAATYPNATDPDWYIVKLGEEGPYRLYHDEPEAIVHGFVLCEADFDLDNGPWYDLTYVTYVQENATLPGCEFVGIQVASL